MAKKKHKNRTNKTTKIGRNQDNISSNKSEFTYQELNIKSNFMFYIILFSAFFSITLFIFYFLPSLDAFSYLVSFYSKNLVNFFIISFVIVILCLLVGALYKYEIEKVLPGYRQIFFGLNAVIMPLIVIPITIGYSSILNDPTIALIFFAVDIVVELTPIAVGYKIFKNIKSV